MGPQATNIERRAERELLEGKDETQIVHSDIALINKQIKEHNKFVVELRKSIEYLTKAAKDHLDNTLRKMQSIRVQLIGNTYESDAMSVLFISYQMHLYRTETSYLYIRKNLNITEIKIRNYMPK